MSGRAADPFAKLALVDAPRTDARAATSSVGAGAAAAALYLADLMICVELDSAAFGQSISQLRSCALDARSHPGFGESELAGGLGLGELTKVGALSIKHPTLEDVYLRATGRGLHKAEAIPARIDANEREAA